MIRRAATLAVAATLLGAGAGEAGTFYGAVAPSSAGVSTCTDWTVVQFTGGGHVIGTAGTVSKWFTQAAPGPNGAMRLVILRGTDPMYTVVGQSNMETIAPDIVNAFVTNIPVQGGDRIAVTANGGPCLFPSMGPTVHYCSACNAGPGTTVVADQLQTEVLVNARVYVEPDGDGDGWGDESQDNCLGLANPSQANSDGDGSGDDCDIDDDNDSVLDGEDAFPFDARDSRDNDGDGMGDNTDPDDDNDGVSDVDEARAGSDPNNAASKPITPASVLRSDLLLLPAEGSLRAPVLRAPASVRLAALRRGLSVSPRPTCRPGSTSSCAARRRAYAWHASSSCWPRARWVPAADGAPCG